MASAEAEFERLYVQHAPAVRRLIRFLGADADLADDIVAETFARVWAAPGPIRQGSIRAYLFTIARNLHRRAARRARSHDMLSEDFADSAVTAEQSAEARSDLAAVLSAMNLLPPDDRAALLMRAAERMPYDEIARALGLTVSNAKVRVHRARLKLAASLEKPDEKGGKKR
ncbi:MAG TPA: RNA polymerase sigma factor [Sphingomicrobium sp.]|nr:RNA polymerase sigma factor [Sphingomicrobium sp.]